MVEDVDAVAHQTKEWLVAEVAAGKTSKSKATKLWKLSGKGSFAFSKYHVV